MPKLIYAPKALDDLQEIKKYISGQFGKDKAKTCIKKITSILRQLELF
ncbi:MAG: type II toxin-antitoxin system RelE/ParE family toxin [Lachnospiraceae bacterium]|nr:type II toxin-antitoxin system RelE/ParE family toxin [Lachnospiraceae bacterium]